RSAHWKAAPRSRGSRGTSGTLRSRSPPTSTGTGSGPSGSCRPRRWKGRSRSKSPDPRHSRPDSHQPAQEGRRLIRGQAEGGRRLILAARIARQHLAALGATNRRFRRAVRVVTVRAEAVAVDATPITAVQRNFAGGIADRVNLIVMTPVGKRKQFRLESLEVVGAEAEEDLAALHLRRRQQSPGDLVLVRLQLLRRQPVEQRLLDDRG